MKYGQVDTASTDAAPAPPPSPDLAGVGDRGQPLDRGTGHSAQWGQKMPSMPDNGQVGMALKWSSELAT